MFNINHIIEQLRDKFPPETVSDSIQGLVNRGILEQYTDEDGEFRFQLTDLGLEVGKNLLDNPASLMEDIENFDLDEEDGIV